MTKPAMEALLKEVDAFLSKTGMAETTFGRKAVNDGKLIARLRRGGRAWPETVAAIRGFIKSSPVFRRPRRAA